MGRFLRRIFGASTGRFRALGGVCLLACAGCGTPVAGPVAAPRPTAHVDVENLAPHAWRLVVRLPGGEAVHAMRVAPRGRGELTVPAAADLMIEQTLVSPTGEAAETRRVAVRFAAGERYRWELATLLTGGNEAPASP